MKHAFSYVEPHPTKEQAQKLESLDISWIKTTDTGSEYLSHNLVKANEKRLKVAMTRKEVLYDILCIPLGAYITTLSSNEYNQTGDIFALFLGVGFGLAITFTGVSRLFFRKSFIFDKALSYYWFSSPNFNPFSSVTTREKRGRLSAIIAIQILQKRARYSKWDRKRDYKSYELNIVLETTERLQVMCAGSEKDIITEARKLNAFLGVPIMSGHDSSI